MSQASSANTRKLTRRIRRKPPSLRPQIVDRLTRHSAQLETRPSHLRMEISVHPGDDAVFLRVDYDTGDDEFGRDGIDIPIAALDEFALGVRALIADLRRSGVLMDAQARRARS